MLINAQPKPAPPGEPRSNKNKGDSMRIEARGGDGSRAARGPVQSGAGLRRGRATEAGAPPAGKNARLCSRPGLQRLPLSLCQKIPPGPGSLGHGQVSSGRPGPRHGKRTLAGAVPGRRRLCPGVRSCPRLAPESPRTTFSVLAQRAEREAGTRALFIGARRPAGPGPGARLSPRGGSRQRGSGSPGTPAERLPPGVERTPEQAGAHRGCCPGPRPRRPGERAARRVCPARAPPGLGGRQGCGSARPSPARGSAASALPARGAPGCRPHRARAPGELWQPRGRPRPEGRRVGGAWCLPLARKMSLASRGGAPAHPHHESTPGRPGKG